MTMGEKIAKLRKENNITQEDLASILHVSRQSVSKREANQAYPETDKLIKMAKIFHCSTDYLLLDEETKVDEVNSEAIENNDNNESKENLENTVNNLLVGGSGFIKKHWRKAGIVPFVSGILFILFSILLFVLDNVVVKNMGFGDDLPVMGFNLFALFALIIGLVLLIIGIIFIVKDRKYQKEHKDDNK